MDPLSLITVTLMIQLSLINLVAHFTVNTWSYILNFTNFPEPSLIKSEQ